jgi:formylmethanofuran dehydrogenase subunit C
MNSHRLTLRAAIPLRLDLRGVLPLALAGLGADAVARLNIVHGREWLPLGEFFDIEALDAPEPTLHFSGDLGRVDHLGWGLDGGALLVDGPVGDHLGSTMRAGSIRVRGSAGDLAGVEMAGGELHIEGDVGHFAAGTLPGSMDGMRGGLFCIHGRAGDRLADRMRRGTLIVAGDVGDFAASRLVAGTVVLGGRAGLHPAYGLRRGSLLWLDPAAAPEPPATFVPARGAVPVFWQLLARDLARLGAAHFAGTALAQRLAALPGLTAQRHLGDLAVDGHGEWLTAG